MMTREQLGAALRVLIRTWLDMRGAQDDYKKAEEAVRKEVIVLPPQVIEIDGVRTFIVDTTDTFYGGSCGIRIREAARS